MHLQALQSAREVSAAREQELQCMVDRLRADKAAAEARSAGVDFSVTQVRWIGSCQRLSAERLRAPSGGLASVAASTPASSSTDGKLPA